MGNMSQLMKNLNGLLMMKMSCLKLSERR
nr:unnamed protein product [Callosobruchus chinensis]